MVYGWFKKIWRVCWFEESHCSPALLKGSYLFHRASCSNFCLKSTVLNVRKHLRPFNFNFTISQQQLRLFIRYSKFFNRAIAHCTWKKRLVLAMRSFKGAIIIYIEYSQPSILSTVLYIFLTLRFYQCNFLSTYFWTPVTVKQISYQSSCIFRTALIILK